MTAETEIIQMNEMTDIRIRKGTIEDAAILAAVEAECFPPAEAATAEEISARLEVFADHFWLLFDGDKLVSFIDGMVCDEPDLIDEMYHDTSYHKEDGRWQMIFGVNTIPAYRRRGLASLLMRRVIEDARTEGRDGCVLTCKEEKIHFYAAVGYRLEFLSSSEHGGAKWYQMRIRFAEENMAEAATADAAVAEDATAEDVAAQGSVSEDRL